MVRKKNSQFSPDLPGTLYQRNGRWWWKVQLPGEPKPKNRSLKPIGAKFATTNFVVACEVARNLWETAVHNSRSVMIILINPGIYQFGMPFSNMVVRTPPSFDYNYTQLKWVWSH